MAAAVAVASLPADVPSFFREARDQLVYLNPEPDRWRGRGGPAMDQAWRYDHYIDLENVPEAALDAPDRFTYLDILYGTGLDQPVSEGGFLPYRILELYQRVVTEWRLWRSEGDPLRRSWIESRLLNDAGILGHYVTDASQPQHTTIHFNGWADGAPNPEGYLEDRTFHARFETDFVEAYVSLTDVENQLPTGMPSAAGDARQVVMDLILRAHAAVDDLYRLDRDVGFDPDGPTRSPTRNFTAERLADGAHVLAVLWWSAWLESA